MYQKKVEVKKTLGQTTEDRLMIEPEIVTWACREATKEQIEHLRMLCDEVEMLYKQGHDHIYKDIEFHSYLAKLSSNIVVEKLIPVINTSVVTFANITYRSLMRETLETHRAIVTAIEHRDAVGAGTVLTTEQVDRAVEAGALAE